MEHGKGSSIKLIPLLFCLRTKDCIGNMDEGQEESFHWSRKEQRFSLGISGTEALEIVQTKYFTRSGNYKVSNASDSKQRVTCSEPNRNIKYTLIPIQPSRVSGTYQVAYEQRMQSYFFNWSTHYLIQNAPRNTSYLRTAYPVAHELSTAPRTMPLARCLKKTQTNSKTNQINYNKKLSPPLLPFWGDCSGGCMSTSSHCRHSFTRSNSFLI